MSAAEKARLYNIYKTIVKPEKHYRDYTADELRTALADLQVDPGPPPPKPEPEPQQTTQSEHVPIPPEARMKPELPNPDELPNQRINSKPEDEPIRVDEQGRTWFQEEVRKPAYPKPRGRRVLKYLDTGVRKETAQAGEYVETFEVAGREPGRPAEVKITLPSYQVGVYKDPRFPFKIHCYNGREGFDLFEVEEFYGGAELVPDTVKRVYIENVLCYDIRTVVRAIRDEHRHLQLTGRAR